MTDRITTAGYRAMRKEVDLTQRQLAQVLGVHEMTIIKREGGKLRIKPESWLAMKALVYQRRWVGLDDEVPPDA